MAAEGLQYGFYNSKADSKREYSAKDFGKMFMGIITDGVLPNIGERFFVKKKDSGMDIQVGTGRAWLKYTYTYLEEPITFEISGGDSQYPRYDTVVIRIGCSETVRENDIYIKQGSPSSNPKPPELEGDPEIEGLSVYEYPIACIYVPTLAQDLSNVIITNLIGADSSTLYPSKYLVTSSEVLSKNEIGKLILNVPTTGWSTVSATNVGTYYTYTFNNLSGKIDINAICYVDMYVDIPNATNNIDRIQKQEDSFGQIFKWEPGNGTLKLYSYSVPEVGFTIRITGKGVMGN